MTHAPDLVNRVSTNGTASADTAAWHRRLETRLSASPWPSRLWRLAVLTLLAIGAWKSCQSADLCDAIYRRVI